MNCNRSLHPEADHPNEEKKWSGEAFLVARDTDTEAETEQDHGSSVSKKDKRDSCECECNRCELVRKSTKQCVGCRNLFPSTIPLLITATPRSGTVGTTRFLRELGLFLSDDAHAPTEYGMVSWIHCFRTNGDDSNDNGNGNGNGNDSSYYGRVGLSGRGFDTVLHQRRHVRKSITSMIYTTPFGTTPKRGRWNHRLYKTFVGTHVPLDTAKSIEYMGLQMYVEWQLFVKAIADGHFCVEDLLSSGDVSVSVPIVERIFASAGLAAPDAQAVRAALARVDPRANTRKHRPTLTWEEIFAIDKHYAQIAHDLSKEYGYD